MSSQVRDRVSRFEVRSVAVSARPFGLSAGETAAAALALIFFALVLVYYFSSLKPEQDRLRAVESRLAAQQKAIIASAVPGGEHTLSLDTSKQALDSLEVFKTQYLKPISQGRIAIISEVNNLARKNNVKLTSGIEMRTQKIAQDTDQKQTASRKNIETALNVFPKVEARFTVFGQYSNLRQFISELERNKQFLVIDSIDISNIDAAQRGGPQAPTGAGLSLSIGLSAYFQP